MREQSESYEFEVLDDAVCHCWESHSGEEKITINKRSEGNKKAGSVIT